MDNSDSSLVNSWDSGNILFNCTSSSCHYSSSNRNTSSFLCSCFSCRGNSLDLSTKKFRMCYICNIDGFIGFISISIVITISNNISFYSWGWFVLYFYFEWWFLLKYCSYYLELLLWFLNWWIINDVINESLYFWILWWRFRSIEGRRSFLYSNWSIKGVMRRPDLTDWQFFLWRDKLWRFFVPHLGHMWSFVDILGCYLYECHLFSH